MATIEKNVPMPPSRHEQWRQAKAEYPLLALEVGDSFLVPVANATRVRVWIARLANGGSDLKFTTRKVGAEHIRVWRVY